MTSLNKHLNTEKWRIVDLSPRGSGSKVVMRIDKQSFDIIIKERNHEINWVLGPIVVEKETHNSKKKKSASAPAKAAAVSHSKLGVTHLTPPSQEVVEGTPKAPRLTVNGGSGAGKGKNRPTVSDG